MTFWHDEITLPCVHLQRPLTCGILTMSLLNARSLRFHFSDVLLDLLTDFADILMFTETDFYKNQASQFQIPQFDYIVSPPEKSHNHHGLSCFFKNNFKCTTKTFFRSFTCLEVLSMYLKRAENFHLCLFTFHHHTPLTKFFVRLRSYLHC